MSLNTSDPTIAYELAHIHDDRRYQVVTSAVVFGTVALISVFLRLISRKINNVAYGLDDFLIVIAMFFGIGLVITASMMAHDGIGKHTIAATVPDIMNIGKTEFALSIMYPPCIAMTKLSIVALLKRIFNHVHPMYTFAMHAINVYLVLWLIGLMLVVLLECRPIHTAWAIENTCVPSFNTTIATSILNSISDVAILVLPQPLLWGLKLQFKKKALISGVFLLGGFVCIISIARIFLLRPNTRGGASDPLYSVTGIIFTILEPMVGIICACLPVMQHLFLRLHYWATSVLSSWSDSRFTTKFESAASGRSSRMNKWSKINPSKATGDEESLSKSGIDSNHEAVTDEYPLGPVPSAYKVQKPNDFEIA